MLSIAEAEKGLSPEGRWKIRLFQFLRAKEMEGNHAKRNLDHDCHCNSRGDFGQLLKEDRLSHIRVFHKLSISQSET